MKMTLKEMQDVVDHDIIKYIGPSTGGLLRNKLYTVKDVTSNLLELFMPKGQKIQVDVTEHALWEMHEAKGAALAKERRLKNLVTEFNQEFDYLAEQVEGINDFAAEMDTILEEFPLESKMKLLSNISKDQMDILDFLHKLKRNKLTVSKLIKAFKRNNHGT